MLRCSIATVAWSCCLVLSPMTIPAVSIDSGGAPDADLPEQAPQAVQHKCFQDTIKAFNPVIGNVYATYPKKGVSMEKPSITDEILLDIACFSFAIEQWLATKFKDKAELDEYMDHLLALKCAALYDHLAEYLPDDAPPGQLKRHLPRIPQ